MMMSKFAFKKGNLRLPRDAEEIIIMMMMME